MPTPLTASGVCIGLTSCVLLIVLLAIYRRIPRQQAKISPAFTEWQLTANREDTPVTSGAISPDGKLLVYSDPTGLYTKQIDSGETHPIPLADGFDPLVESWFPDGSHLLVSWVEGELRQPGLQTLKKVLPLLHLRRK